MPILNGKKVTAFPGLKVKSNNAFSDAVMMFDNVNTAPSTTTGYFSLYCVGGVLTFDDGSTTYNLLTGAGGGISSWDGLYAGDTTLTIDGATLTFAGTHATNAVFTVTGAGTGAAIQITNSSTGLDISGSSAAWTISKAGAAKLTTITGCASVTAATNLALEAKTTGTISIGATSSGAIDIGTGTGAVTIGSTLIITGSADTDVFTITDGDALVDDGQLTITESDTATYALNITSSGTTGGGVAVTADDLTDGALFYGDSDNEAGFTNDGGYLNLTNGGTSVFKVQRYGALTIAGNAEGTDSITVTAGDVKLTDGALVITAGAFTYTAGDMTMSDGSLAITDADDAATFSVTNNTATSASVIALAGSGVHTGTTTTSWMTITPSGMAAGTGVYGVFAGLTTGKGVHLVGDATQTTGSVLYVENTGVSAALTSGTVATFSHVSSAVGGAVNKIGSVVSITSARTVNTGGNTADDFDCLSVIKATTRTAGTAATAGAVIYAEVQSTGTVTETSNGIEVVMDSGGTGNGVKITHAATAGVALNVVSAATTVSDVLITGSGVKSDNKAVLEVTSSGARSAGSAVVRIASTGTPAANTSYLLDLDYSAATEETNDPICMHVDRGQSDEAAIQITGSVADVASSGIISLFATQTGAVGVTMHSQHTSTSSAAAGDSVFVFKHEGLDAGDAVTEYVRVEAEIMTATGGQEDGRYIINCAANDSTLVQMAQFSPRAGGSVGQVVVGASGTNAYLTTLSTSDLVIDTNEGTNSASITIADGAAGDVSVAINGAGSFNVQNLTYETNAGSQITTTATLVWGDAEGQVVLCTSVGGVYAITLPTVASVGAGGWYTFIKNDAAANAITITGSGAELIDGSNTYASLDADYDSVTIMCDGVEWFIVSEKLA